MFKGSKVKEIDSSGIVWSGDKPSIRKDLMKSGYGFIMFYMPSCGYCHQASPIIQKLADKLSGSTLDVLAMDGTKYPSVMQKLGVHGYPTIVAIEKHQVKMGDEVRRESESVYLDEICKRGSWPKGKLCSSSFGYSRPGTNAKMMYDYRDSGGWRSTGYPDQLSFNPLTAYHKSGVNGVPLTRLTGEYAGPQAAHAYSTRFGMSAGSFNPESGTDLVFPVFPQVIQDPITGQSVPNVLRFGMSRGSVLYIDPGIFMDRKSAETKLIQKHRKLARQGKRGAVYDQLRRGSTGPAVVAKLVKIEGPGFFGKMKWRRGTRSVWNQLKKYHPVFLADTGVGSRGIKGWISKNIGPTHASRMIMERKKEKFAKKYNKPAVLIDTVESKTYLFTKKGGSGIHYRNNPSTVLRQVKQILG